MRSLPTPDLVLVFVLVSVSDLASDEDASAALAADEFRATPKS
jgi:hypothetical protein